jgi:anti-anti-sigma factor
METPKEVHRVVDYAIAHFIKGETVIISAKGGCNDKCAREAEELIDSYLAKGFRNFILDVSELSFIETPGLRLVVRKFSRIQECGGMLVLTGMKGRVARTFNLMKMNGIVPTMDTPDMALEMLEFSGDHVSAR